LIDRIPFEAPEIDTYDDSKHQLIDYGLKLLDLSQDSAVVSESSHQEAVMSIVCMSRVLEFFCADICSPSLWKLWSAWLAYI